MSQTIISTQDAPQAIGPYVQARKVGPWLFTSGQIPIDPSTGHMIEANLAAQTKLALKNLAAVIQAAGGDLHHVVKTTLFIKNMDHFAAINEIYAEFFGEHKPARSCVEVARLPKDALVEIECIALIE